MAHFYATARGSRGEVTRCGSKASGMETVCASWQGAVQCTAYVDVEGIDCVTVEKVRWLGAGVNQVLYDGPIGDGVAHDHPRHRNPGSTTPCPECERREAGYTAVQKEAAGIDNSPHFPDAA